MSDPNLTPTAPAVADPQPPATPAQPAVAAAPPATPPTDPDPVERYRHLYEPAPAPEPSVADLVGTIQALSEQIAQLKQSAPAPAAAPEDSTKFISLLREGKFEEAEAYITAQAVERAKRELEPSIIDQLNSQRTVEQELYKFNEQMRRENPDIVAAGLEDLVATRAERELFELHKVSPPKSSVDFVNAYKAVVAKHIDAARRTVQQIRGAGHQDALNATKGVGASGAVPPASARQEPVPGSGQPTQPRSALDIIRERQARTALYQGVG